MDDTVVDMFFESIERCESDIMNLEVERYDIWINLLEEDKLLREKEVMFNEMELKSYYLSKEKCEESLKNGEDKKKYTEHLEIVEKNIEVMENILKEFELEFKEIDEDINKTRKEKENSKLLNDLSQIIDMDEKLCLDLKRKLRY